MSEPTSWIQFGIISRAHGVRGELRVIPHAPNEPLPEAAKVVRVLPRRGGERLLVVHAVRKVRDALLLSLEGIEDREAAQALGGAVLEIDAATLPPLAPGEIYLYELDGAVVQDEAGVRLGTVRRVTGSREQDILEIESEAGERLLPLVPETLVGFDRARRILTVRPVPGLWD